ncbi:MAG TPA: type II toxin-antitoxin system HicB family antitoxin [Solirubrobacterales bacterium]|nr:type II toxin-antitoxin system HicB family antitoxin [Solirubrobacterales bacterium]
MSVLAVGNTVYPDDVAKVLISIPDDLLSRIDGAANRAGESRSGFLRRVAEREVEESNARVRKELEDLFELLSPAGGESGRWMHEDREHRDDKRFGPRRDDR